ncbi:unnamed protein product [Heligmosomoides polygyrus]|uniref:Reverse transcriptase domain-containing protein n=1 Tax=Heligmosomoides polygyrus TaxID=6339 RepID=A0A183FX12_HELPZ|nr:unnamed protein product [Heligmosomoides polygyrus]
MGFPISVERFGLKLKVKKTEYLTTDVTESSSIEVNGIQWSKWRSLTGVLCDRKIPEHLKSKIYRAVVWPVTMYGAECWPAKEVETRLSVMEAKVLQMTAEVTRIDRIRNEMPSAEVSRR